MIPRLAFEQMRANLTEAEREELDRLACELRAARASADAAELAIRAAAFEGTVRLLCTAKGIPL